MFDKETIFTKLAEILRQMPMIDDNTPITLDSTLQEDLGLDSISGLGLLFMAEQEFNLKIDDSEVSALKTVREVVDIIHRYVNDPSYAPPADL